MLYTRTVGIKLSEGKDPLTHKGGIHTPAAQPMFVKGTDPNIY